MTDLTTKYLGLTLRTPIVASAGRSSRESVDFICVREVASISPDT